MEGILVKKRNDQTKLRKQVSDLQEKIRVLTQKLSAKKLVVDVLTQEIETLTKGYKGFGVVLVTSHNFLGLYEFRDRTCPPVMARHADES